MKTYHILLGENLPLKRFEDDVKPRIEEDGSIVGDNTLLVEYYKYNSGFPQLDLLVTISSENIEKTLEESFRMVEKEFYENKDFSTALLETGTNMDREERIKKAKPLFKIVGQYKDTNTADKMFDSLATKYLTHDIPNSLRGCIMDLSDKIKDINQTVSDLKKDI